MKYPKLHGKSLTKEQKAEFDKWRETFGWIINLEMGYKGTEAPEIAHFVRNPATVAWNSAYEVMADKYK